MQYSLFDTSDTDMMLEQDNRLDRGEFFAVSPERFVFINKREGITVSTKGFDVLNRLQESRRCVARFPILPLEILRWDDHVFYVRLLYSNKEQAPVEKVVSLEAILKPGMPELRKLLKEEGILLSTREALSLNRVLLDVLRSGTVKGSIPVKNRVLRRDWYVDGITLVRRTGIVPLTLIANNPSVYQ